jgi:hypothetical protein
MGRLKRDHSGWSTSGKWLKYQQPKINEQPVKGKSKKDTRRWCRGKVGVEHDFHQTVRFTFFDEKYYNTKCVECRKEVSKKRVKSYPLHLDIEKDSGPPQPIQVKVNGVAIPIDYRKFYDGGYWCDQCREWHF